MKTNWNRKLSLAALLTCALAAPLHSAILINGGFESGLAGWTKADQLGSEGSYFSQTGVVSPVNGFPVPAPPEGTFAAMTDAAGSGSHVLYQDFLIPLGASPASISFQLYINNGYGAPDFYAPASLDFSTAALNQQARVDIITTTADPFSVAGPDVLLALYQTLPGRSLVSGYSLIQVDLSAFFLAHQGETVRLRFAEVDNVAPFNLGVDAVSLNAEAIPEPSTWMTMAGALLAAGWLKRRR